MKKVESRSVKNTTEALDIIRARAHRLQSQCRAVRDVVTNMLQGTKTEWDLLNMEADLMGILEDEMDQLLTEIEAAQEIDQLLTEMEAGQDVDQLLTEMEAGQDVDQLLTELAAGQS